MSGQVMTWPVLKGSEVLGIRVLLSPFVYRVVFTIGH